MPEPLPHKCLKTLASHFGDRAAIPTQEPKSEMIRAVGASSTEIYEAVVALSRSIAGRSDLESLLSGVAESLRRIVQFETVAVILHDSRKDQMQGHILREPGCPAVTLFLPVDQDPAGWVWRHQQPLVIPLLEAEARWPEFRDRALSAGVASVSLVPLTAGDNRLGAFGFGCAGRYEPTPAELAFLERIATEFAVAVESFLARQAAVRERDRLRTLFEITNALVSKLSPDELAAAISTQLAKVVRHDFSVLTLLDEAGALEIQYIEEFFGEFPRKKTASEIVARLQEREFLILIAEAPLPNDPGRVAPVAFKVVHEIRAVEDEPKLVDLVGRLDGAVQFEGRKVLYSWIGGTRRDWRGQGHFRALTEESEAWAHAQGFHEVVVKTKNRFYDMRGTLDQLEFNVVKYEPTTVDNRESKVYLSKRLSSDVVRAHTSMRTVVYAD